MVFAPGVTMPRSIWKGSIAFGLVQIPVDLHPAEEPKELSFRQLDKHDFSPIGYERINKSTGKKVDWNDIVRGYEYDKGEYVVLSDEEIEAANVEATHTIDIAQFVDASEIDPMYFDKPYYLAPTKQGQKAYALLRETLLRAGVMGVCKVVIRTRQHLGAIYAKDRAIVLVLMRYDDELRKPDQLDLPGKDLEKLGVHKRELDMAQMLVEGMRDEFDPSKFHDDYRNDVMALIERKAKAGEINTVTEVEAPHVRRHPAKVVDLMSLLKQSVEQSGGRPKRKRASAPSLESRRGGKKSA